MLLEQTYCVVLDFRGHQACVFYSIHQGKARHSRLLHTISQSKTLRKCLCCPVLSYPISSHPIPSHPIPSHPILSYKTYFVPVTFPFPIYNSLRLPILKHAKIAVHQTLPPTGSRESGQIAKIQPAGRAGEAIARCARSVVEQL